MFPSSEKLDSGKKNCLKKSRFLTLRMLDLKFIVLFSFLAGLGEEDGAGEEGSGFVH